MPVEREDTEFPDWWCPAHGCTLPLERHPTELLELANS